MSYPIEKMMFGCFIEVDIFINTCQREELIIDKVLAKSTNILYHCYVLSNYSLTRYILHSPPETVCIIELYDDVCLQIDLVPFNYPQYMCWDRSIRAVLVLM